MRNDSAGVLFASLLNRGPLFMENICSHTNKVFPLRMFFFFFFFFFFGRAVSSRGEQTGNHKVVSLCKNDEKT